MSLIGEKAPLFKATATLVDRFIEVSLEEELSKSYVMLFFYPLDFTFVCPTELLAFQNKLSEIEACNTKLFACSIDSQFTHKAWLEKESSEGGIKGVKYPIIADIKRSIAKDYGVLTPEGVAYRALFIIDKKGIVRHVTLNDLPVGRSVEEAIRTLQAIQHSEKYGEVCPANWKIGGKAIEPNSDSLNEYLASEYGPSN